MRATFTLRHVRVQAGQGFSEVVSGLERLLGSLEPSTLSAPLSHGGAEEGRS